MKNTHRPISAWENDIANVIGVDALIALERQHGGKRLYVHAKTPSQALIDVIGTTAASELTDWFGGSDIYVPCVILRKIRNEEIEREALADRAAGQNAGKTIHELAAKFRISTRRIKSIIQERGINERTHGNTRSK